MKTSLKKAVSLMLVFMMCLTVGVPAFAEDVPPIRDDGIAYDVNIKYKSNKIVFTGGVYKNISALSAYAQGTYYRNGEEFDEFDHEANGNRSHITYYANSTSAIYDYEFYGQIVDPAERLWTVQNKTYNYNMCLKNWINSLGNAIINSLGYNAKDYTTVNINQLPECVVKYYFNMHRGIGSKKPVIYFNSSSHQYLIAYQDADGVNIVHQISLSGQNSINNISRKSIQSTKLVFDASDKK